MKINIFDKLTDSEIFTLMKEQKGVMECKFVLISNPEEINLLFGPLREYNYHAKLVEYFCEQYRIPSGWEHRPDLYQIYSSPYRINGGGWFLFDFTKNKLIIHGRSTAYGRFNQTKMNDVLKSSKLNGNFEVEIKD